MLKQLKRMDQALRVSPSMPAQAPFLSFLQVFRQAGPQLQIDFSAIKESKRKCLSQEQKNAICIGSS